MVGNRHCGTLSLLPAMAACLLAFSCVSVVHDTGQGPMDEMQDPPEGESPHDTAYVESLYVTGVEFPSGYDWSAGEPPLDGTPCVLFLMSGGEKVLELPVGESSRISADKSRHRCVAGHLYTDYADETGTVVMCDGREVFSYDSPERLVSFSVTDDGIYTLGVPDGGGCGLCLRLDGKVLYADRNARVLSPLHEDCGKQCFSFWTCPEDSRGAPVNPSPAQPRTFYMYCGGRLKEIVSTGGSAGRYGTSGCTCGCLLPVDGVKDVFAAEMHGNRPVCIYSQELYENRDRYSVYDGRYPNILQTYKYNRLSMCRIMRGRDRLFVYGELNYSYDRLKTPFVWTLDGVEHVTFNEYKQSYCTLVSGNDIYSFIGYQSYPPSVTLYRNGERMWTYSSGIGVPSSDAAVVHEGKVYLVFTDIRRQNIPCLAVDEDVTDYGFNGYFTGIYVCRSPRDRNDAGA